MLCDMLIKQRKFFKFQVFGINIFLNKIQLKTKKKNLFLDIKKIYAIYIFKCHSLQSH